MRLKNDLRPYEPVILVDKLTGRCQPWPVITADSSAPLYQFSRLPA